MGGKPSDSIAAAKRQIARLKGAKLLDGARGKPPADVEALAELMVRLSTFIADAGADIAEIDLNPVLVHEHGKGVTVVDALLTRAKPE